VLHGAHQVKGAFDTSGFLTFEKQSELHIIVFFGREMFKGNEELKVVAGDF
jgi:hypothetical protein